MATQYAIQARRNAWEHAAKEKELELERRNTDIAEEESKRKFITNLISSIGGALVGKAGIVGQGLSILKARHDAKKAEEADESKSKYHKGGKR